MFKQIYYMNLVHQNFIPFLYLTSWRDQIQKNSKHNSYMNLKNLICSENGLINKIDIQEIEKEIFVVVYMIRKINNEGMKVSHNSRGDLFVRFNIILPNLSNLPTDTKSQFKSLLQSFDKVEVQQESQVIKTPNLTKTILSECKQSDTINNLMDTLKNNKQKEFKKSYKKEFDDSDSSETEAGNTGQPQCVQQ